MADYIKKEDAISLFKGRYSRLDVINQVRALPPEDVAPVRHGHWIIKCVREYELSYGGMAYVPEYECSCCGNVTESYVRLDEPIMPDDADFPKYCEDCGARMDWKDLDRWKDEQKAKGKY